MDVTLTHHGDLVQRYIITGAPGTGKSTLLNALQQNAFSCFHEVSRTIIQQQQAIGGTLLPWIDMQGFARTCRHHMLQHCYSAPPGISFYDRALPDIMAYLAQQQLPIHPRYYRHINMYQPRVFFCTLWPEIFINDPQRPETLQQAAALEHHLLVTYQKLGFHIIRVPHTTISRRVLFIRQQLGLL